MSSERRPRKKPLSEFEQDALRSRGSLISKLALIDRLIRLIREEPGSPQDTARIPELEAHREKRASLVRQYDELVGKGSPRDIERLRTTLLGLTASVLAGPEEDTVHAIYDQSEVIPPKIAELLEPEIAALHGAINSYFDEQEPPTQPDEISATTPTVVPPQAVDGLQPTVRPPSPADLARLVAQRPASLPSPATSVAANGHSANREAVEPDILPDDAEVLVLQLLFENGTRLTHIGKITRFVYLKPRVEGKPYDDLIALLNRLVARGDVTRVPDKPLYQHALYNTPDDTARDSTATRDAHLDDELRDAGIYKAGRYKSSDAPKRNRYRGRRLVHMSAAAEGGAK